MSFVTIDDHCKSCGELRCCPICDIKEPERKPPTKRQLWRRVTRLAGELIVGNGLQSNYLLPKANLFNSDEPSENIRGLIKHARYLGDCARRIAKLEAALKAWEAAP